MTDDTATRTEALSQQILDNARKEAKKTIDRAEREAEKSLAKAVENAQKESEAILKNARERADAETRKITGAIPMLVKRKILIAQEAIIEGMLELGLNAAGKAPKNGDRPDVSLPARGPVPAFLERLILNAALIINEGDMIVEANERDMAGISGEMLNRVAAQVKQRQERSIAISLSDRCAPITGGVIVRGKSGRVICDNSFEARLSRSREELRLKLAKALFDQEDL